MTNKDFIKGRVVKKVFDNGGYILKVSMPIEEINRVCKAGWINFSICEMRQPVEDKNGKPKTHYMVNDNVMPPEGTKDHPQAEKVMSKEEQEDINVQNIPF